MRERRDFPGLSLLRERAGSLAFQLHILIFDAARQVAKSLRREDLCRRAYSDKAHELFMKSLTKEHLLCAGSPVRHFEKIYITSEVSLS